MIGVGLGVVGVAVSPMLGLTDGLNSVAQTIFIQSAEGSLRVPLRPPRALVCLTQAILTPGPYPMMGGRLVLTSLDLHAAQAQAAVMQMVKNMGQSDLFVAFLSLVSRHADSQIMDCHVPSHLLLYLSFPSLPLFCLVLSSLLSYHSQPSFLHPHTSHSSPRLFSHDFLYHLPSSFFFSPPLNSSHLLHTITISFYLRFLTHFFYCSTPFFPLPSLSSAFLPFFSYLSIAFVTFSYLPSLCLPYLPSLCFPSYLPSLLLSVCLSVASIERQQRHTN